jgi:hypothetical protein
MEKQLEEAKKEGKGLEVFEGHTLIIEYTTKQKPGSNL